MPFDESHRLVAVRRYDVLDSPPDGAFDRITAVAARLFDVPIAVVSIVDTDRAGWRPGLRPSAPDTSRSAAPVADARRHVPADEGTRRERPMKSRRGARGRSGRLLAHRPPGSRLTHLGPLDGAHLAHPDRLARREEEQ